MKKTRKNKRNSMKRPGLSAQTTLKIRADLLDQDYYNKLNDEELDWMNQFNEEYVNGRVYKSKDGSYKPKFHKKKSERKLVNDMNNSRNRDAYSKAKITGKLDLELPKTRGFYTAEDEIIDAIDAQNEIERLLSTTFEKDKK